MREVIELGLDSPAIRHRLERFLRRIADAYEVPMCLVSIVTDTRQYWMAGIGIPDDLLPQRGTTVSQSFCVHTVAARSPLVVQDAYANPAFASNPLVLSRGLRFYAGVPLFTRSGEAVGTLCIIDYRDRRFTHPDLALLSVLARCVMAEIEAHEKHVRGDACEAGYRYSNDVDIELGILGRRSFADALAADAQRQRGRGRALTLVVVSAPDVERLRRAVAELASDPDVVWLGRLAATRAGALVYGAWRESGAAALRSAVDERLRVCVVSANAQLADASTILHQAETANER
jgi:signal transduction protein with GAF and PtsI domain